MNFENIGNLQTIAGKVEKGLGLGTVLGRKIVAEKFAENIAGNFGRDFVSECDKRGNVAKDFA